MSNRKSPGIATADIICHLGKTAPGIYSPSCIARRATSGSSSFVWTRELCREEAIQSACDCCNASRRLYVPFPCAHRVFQIHRARRRRSRRQRRRHRQARTPQPLRRRLTFSQMTIIGYGKASAPLIIDARRTCCVASVSCCRRLLLTLHAATFRSNSPRTTSRS